MCMLLCRIVVVAKGGKCQRNQPNENNKKNNKTKGTSTYVFISIHTNVFDFLLFHFPLLHSSHPFPQNT